MLGSKYLNSFMSKSHILIILFLLLCEKKQIDKMSRVLSYIQRKQDGSKSSHWVRRLTYQQTLEHSEANAIQNVYLRRKQVQKLHDGFVESNSTFGYVNILLCFTFGFTLRILFVNRSVRMSYHKSRDALKSKWKEAILNMG
jgi:hypothetical protein